MPYLTLTENLKLQLSPGLVASYDIQKGVGLFWDKHTHTFTYLLTCPGPTRGKTDTQDLQDQYWKSMTGMDCDKEKD